MRSRQEICQTAAARLVTADLATQRVVVGLDGFVDEIIDVVDKRTSATVYERLATISQFGEKISLAAGKSCNFELVVKHQKLGGNGPIMANALAAIGFATTYVGNLGNPSIHPVFQPLAASAQVISIAAPAHTNALEFVDGKIMLGNLTPLSEITWERLLQHVGLERLVSLIDGASLLGLVNWTMLPHMTNIWEGLVANVFPRLSKADRTVFIDLADPEKRLIEDLRGALTTLQKINSHLHVILGLNLSEAQQVGKAHRFRPDQQSGGCNRRICGPHSREAGIGHRRRSSAKRRCRGHQRGLCKFSRSLCPEPQNLHRRGRSLQRGVLRGTFACDVAPRVPRRRRRDQRLLRSECRKSHRTATC